MPRTAPRRGAAHEPCAAPVAARPVPRPGLHPVLALQRAAGNAAIAARLQAVPVQRERYDECDAPHKEQIQEAHNRAKRLVQITVAKLRVYKGLNPDQPGYAAEFPIRQALQTHFHTTSAAVGRFIADSLVHLLYMCHHVQYECHAGERSGSDYAKTLWCIPFTDISIYQRFFDVSDLDFKAGTLVHEWCHKYLCALDVGYTDDPEYANASTARALVNAEAYDNLVKQLGPG